MTKPLGRYNLYQALGLLEQLQLDDPEGKFKLIAVNGMLEWEVVMEVR